MHFEGTLTVKTKRENVWKFLVDPKQVSKCLPDVQKLEVLDETRFNVTVKIGIGVVKGISNFKFQLSDLSPPSHARLVGTGSSPGSAINFESIIDLEEAGKGETAIKWSAEAQVGGMLAGIGSRLMQGASEKITKELFDCIKRSVEK